MKDEKEREGKPDQKKELIKGRAREESRQGKENTNYSHGKEAAAKSQMLPCRVSCRPRVPRRCMKGAFQGTGEKQKPSKRGSEPPALVHLYWI